MNDSIAKDCTKKKNIKSTRKNKEIKVIEINKPTPEQAKAKIKQISEELNKMYSNDYWVENDK